MIFNKNSFFAILLLFALITNDAFSDSNDIASIRISKLEGVYKNRFTNMLYDGSGEKYTSEDIVEIVRYSGDEIYFRVELEFSNGHSCSKWGIAKYNNNTFTYKSSEKPIIGTESCSLKISTDKKNLIITDRQSDNSNSTCQQYCGARGSLSNYKISLSKKREIKYLPIIKKSDQYIEAIDEYEKINLAK
ncbi:MAG: hypothetical protein ACXV8O_19655 [Methylobacter sp.]